jgi:hypothetical protein
VAIATQQATQPAATQAIPTQPSAATATPAVAVTPGCQPNQLTLAIASSQGAAGHIAQMAQFTNKSNTVCTLFGFPGAVMLDAQHNAIPTKALWETSSYTFQNQQKQTVTLHPGGSAYFAVAWSDVPVGSETTCPTSAYLSVTPPNTFSVLTIADQINACNSGSLDISPVEPTKFMG